MVQYNTTNVPIPTLLGVVGSYEHGVDVLSHKSSVIYIDTELKFDPNRLVQMALERHPDIYSSEFRSDSAHQVDSLLTAVKVIWKDRTGV